MKSLATVALSAFALLAGAHAAGASPPAWRGCADEELRQAGAQCATLKLPLDYAEPNGRTIDLAISRIRARDRAHRRGILLVNPGGPGIPGLSFPLTLQPALGDVADRYDLIGFDPRMVGRSTPVSCGPLPEGWWQWSPGSTRAGFDRLARFGADWTRRCHAPAGQAELLPHASTRNVARDMDRVRRALGEPKLSFYGVSYGTKVGAFYSELYGSKVDRLVLDSAFDVSRPDRESDQALGPVLEHEFDRWAPWAARRHRELALGDTAAAVRATVVRLVRDAERAPMVIGGRSLDGRLLPLFLSGVVGEQDDRALGLALRDLVEAAAGRPPAKPTRELADFLTLVASNDPRAALQASAQATIYCADSDWPRDPEAYWRAVQAKLATQPIFGPFANGIAACAFWPTGAREGLTDVRNDVRMLIVQNEHDTSTPLAEALRLHRRLPRSRLVTTPLRSHGVFTRRGEGAAPIRCAERVVNEYLRDGTLPVEDTRCRLPKRGKR